MEGRKSNKGLVICLIILLLAFVCISVLLGMGIVKSPFVKCDDCKDTVVTDDTKKADNNTEDAGLKEGYLVYEKDYRIYGIYNYVELATIIVGYNDNLYLVDGGDNQVGCIKKLGELQFDENNRAKCGWDHGDDSEVGRFTTKESELSKVVFRVPIGSTSGYKTPVLIRKDGTIEANQITTKALKDYKIKDFIEETCIEHPTDGNRFPGDCLKGAYKVILQDGTEKTIEATYGE